MIVELICITPDFYSLIVFRLQLNSCDFSEMLEAFVLRGKL